MQGGLNNKKVILTGSTGLIGKEAIIPLQNSGYEVYCLTSKECNLFDYEKVSAFFNKIKPQYLLHFAWITGGDYLSNPINTQYVDASMNMLKAFAKNGGKTAVFSGTCFEYNFNNELLKEDSPLNPTTLYAKSKVLLNEKATEFCKENGILFSWGRIFYVYGHNEKEGRFVQSIISKLKNDEVVQINYGQLVRDYMYTKDIASAFVALLDSKVEGNVNICNGEGISLGDFATLIASNMGKTHLLDIKKLETTQPKTIIGDNTKLCTVIDNKIANDYNRNINQILKDYL